MRAAVTPSRQFVTKLAIGVVSLAVVALPWAAPSAAQARGLQPVTVVTSVDGVVGAAAVTGSPTTVSFAVTNASSSSSLGAFSVVIPSGVSDLRSAGVVGPGRWSQVLLPCRGTARCSAILLVSAGFPLRSSLLRPGGTVTTSVSFTAPAAPTTLSFPLIGIGGGLFTVSGPTPSVSVEDAGPTAFEVTVPATVAAGAPVSAHVQALGSTGDSVPYAGGQVDVVLGSSDPAATADGTPIGADGSATVTVPASATGAFTVPLSFTVAQSQHLTLTDGAVSGGAAFTVTAGAPARLQVTGLADVSSDPPLPTPASGQPFVVRVDVLDAYGNLATTPDIPVSLSALGGTGTLSAPTVTSSGGSAVVTATYSVAQADLQLQAGSPGLAPDVTSTGVVTAGVSTTLTPGVPATLVAGTATATLGNGGVGDAFLTTEPCATSGSDACGGSRTLVSLDGVFTHPSLGELYSFTSPAKVGWSCPVERCPHVDVYSGDRRDQVEDFVAYPVEVSLKVGGVYQPFAVAPSCVDLNDWTKRGMTGVIDSAAARAAGFCIDVYAISRDYRAGDRSWCHTGDLVRPVLFVEDPKMRG